MFKKKLKKPFDIIETLIGKNTILEGNVKTDKSIRIDGKIIGNINAEGVLIGQTAEVIGDIEAKTINIAGTVKGNAKASETIEIATQANIFGDLKTNVLTIAEGAHFYGKSLMNHNESTKKIKES
jgi:cytoskeletal protein CcmA (bactofilin family)